MNPQYLTKLLHVLFILPPGDSIDILEQPKRLNHRNVPPKLRLLSKDHPDPPGILDPVGEGILPHDPDGSFTWFHDPGQHLDGRRFPRTVQSQKRHALSLFNAKRDSSYGF